jgi:hypothetical protein
LQFFVQCKDRRLHPLKYGDQAPDILQWLAKKVSIPLTLMAIRSLYPRLLPPLLFHITAARVSSHTYEHKPW